MPETRPALLALSAMAFLSATATAETRFGMGYEPVVSGFALVYERYDTDLAIEGVDIKTRIEKLGITFTQPLSAALSGDIDLGYLSTFQGDNPVTGDNKQYGGYLGVGLNAITPLSEALALGGELDYAFNLADGEVGDVQTEVNWREARARVYVDLNLSAARFRVGAQGQSLNGEFDYDDTPAQTFTFDEAQTTGAFAGIDLFVDGGRIGLYGQSGDRRGISIYFAADY